ncbi:hypothetical protein [Desulfuromonas sp. CSMB_57]|uniref:hypothetical protein n=1 Tax=Desulfuromonas sp. CSMB_57 TaxID=2807629 RepID=UPI001CD1BE88|nr:hypothetical protein [Desulfuromonas sp. CSMB_57]
MSTNTDSVAALVERIQKKAPEYLDLLTAETDADFEQAFNAVLATAVSWMERNKKSYQTLDEVGLTSVLAARLSIPGLTVSQESHSNGHVDLFIVADHCVPERIKLGEAKIYDGYSYHIGGLKQLLGRYTTGRETRGLLIVYVQKKDITGLIKKLRGRMNTERPCSQGRDTADHVLKWSFLSEHFHSCGENLEISHIGCNLYVDNDATTAS